MNKSAMRKRQKGHKKTAASVLRSVGLQTSDKKSKKSLSPSQPKAAQHSAKSVISSVEKIAYLAAESNHDSSLETNLSEKKSSKFARRRHDVKLAAQSSKGDGSKKMKTGVSPNLLDVARHAGVSRSTASLVLRKSPLVAEETRLKVQNAMKELGYVYNRAAAMLREGRTHIASLLVCDIGNPSIAHVISGFDRQLQRENYFSILSGSNDLASVQKYILQRMKEHNIDGVALCPALNTTPRFMNELKQSGLPVVQLLRRLNGYEADYVGADYGQGVRLAIEHLVKLGHKKIAFLGGEGNSSALQERYDSFRSVTKTLNLPGSIIQPTALKSGAGAEGMQHLLTKNSKLTAVICFNDLIALDAMHFLLSKGRMPGKDFSVIGVDDFSVASSVWPALTTVSTRSSDVGEEAARLLLRRIVEPQASIEQVVLPVKLIVRQSTGPAPSSL